MKLQKLACLAGLVLAFAGSQVSAAVQSRWEQWLNSYYQNPQPDQVATAVYGLSRDGYFEQSGATATAIGFFSAVFAQNPDKIDRWFADFRDLPQSEQRLMASALWYSGNPKGEKVLAKLARDASAESRADIARLIRADNQSIAATPVRSDSSMNLQWGAFLASGEARYVTNILAAIGQGDVGESARVSLAFNAARHDRVLEICRDQVNKQPNEVRSVLRAVINDAERKQPTT